MYTLRFFFCRVQDRSRSDEKSQMIIGGCAFRLINTTVVELKRGPRTSDFGLQNDFCRIVKGKYRVNIV